MPDFCTRVWFLIINGCKWKINLKFNCWCTVISVTLSLKLWIPNFKKFLRSKIIYWQILRHHRNLSLANTLINIYSPVIVYMNLYLPADSHVSPYAELSFKNISNILLSSSCSYPLDTAQPQVTSAGSGLVPPCSHVQWFLRFCWYLHLYWLYKSRNK